jgi:hypothetical protein
VVKKKMDASGEQKWRLVVDFRKLNEITVADTYPLPVIEEILDQLGNAKYFSVLDLASGFYQMELAKEDREKTAFTTAEGKYQFKRHPMGLKNSPAMFQRMMDSVLSGLNTVQCLIYMDDLIVFGSTLEQHNKRLMEVLERLKENGLKVQLDKCEFLRKEINYLGHVISENGVAPDPSKIEKVKNYPRPTDIKGIQAFLGFAGYYRRFIKCFAEIAKPLSKLTRKEEKFVWGTEQQLAFEELRDKLISAPILQHPNFEKEFVITTDASNLAIGGVLSQGKVGEDLPIAYASRVLNSAEKNYPVVEKELLAIVWTIKHFRPYLYGKRFVVYTDHRPLTYLFNLKDPSSRLMRWRLHLEEYNFEIKYKEGKINRNADALCRIFKDS